MEKERRFLKKVSKKILPKEHRKKIKKVKDKNDKYESLNYLISTQLKLMFHELELIVKQKGFENHLSIKSKLISIPSKIKYFSQNPNNEDFKKILNLFNKIEKEIRNV